jgi:type III secretion protein C
MKRRCGPLWRRVRAVALLLSLACVPLAPAGAAAPASWNDTGFSIDTKGMRLGRVLEQFGAAYGVHVNSTIGDGAPLNMRIKAANGTEFLDRLAASGDFRWFYYSNTVYVVPRGDQVSVRLEVGEDAVQDSKAALVGIGLFDTRFGWGELPDEGVVMVSGPRAYVDLVRGLLMPDQKPAAPAQKGKQLMVFRLKYATAADRTINTRGQKETIPGIKTILTGLLDSGSPPKAADSEFDLLGHKRSGKGPSARGGIRTLGAEAAARLGGGDTDGDGPEAAEPKRKSKISGLPNGDRPRIDADPSLNAIIIYDDVAKRASYQALIAELDVEPRQIEIEALIVDIDRSKLGELGVEWGVKTGSTTTVVNAGMSDSSGVELPVPGATLLINNASRFYARLKAMEGTGDARVLAKPTVLTLDNVAAVLDLSQTAYVSLVGERVADLADITVGTMLRVVPRIVQEGAMTRVRLEVDIEDGSMGDTTTSSNGTTTAPKVTRSTISTQAIVDGQQTLMIGGYHAESVSRQNQKVPVLGDVPVLGGLFRSSSESHTSRERLFLITPRLTATAGAAAAALSKANRLARRTAVEEAKRQIREELAEQGLVRPATGLATIPQTAQPAPAVQLPAPQATSSKQLLPPIPPPAPPGNSLLSLPLPSAVPPQASAGGGTGSGAVAAVQPVAVRTAIAAGTATVAGFRLASGVDAAWPRKSHTIVCKRPRPLLWR